jgi:hypothetical protein
MYWLRSVLDYSPHSPEIQGLVIIASFQAVCHYAQARTQIAAVVLPYRGCT